MPFSAIIPSNNPNVIGVVKDLTVLPGEIETIVTDAGTSEVEHPPRLQLVCILNELYGSEPGSDDTQGKAFIFFQKPRSVNVSEVKGYYGEARFVNGSASQCELFTASCEISESSK